MRRALPVLLAVAVAAVVVVGLTQAGGRSTAAKLTAKDPGYDQQAALQGLKGAPPPLAALHGQANALLGGDLPAFRARLRGLRGHPVVVNKWGSWCGPCRAEFPVFQRVGAERGRTVAFVGIDGHDNRGEAKAFLGRFPVTYPSYVDADENIARFLGAPNNYPVTIFVDPGGRVVMRHAGPYESPQELGQDIKRYLGA